MGDVSANAVLYQLSCGRRLASAKDALAGQTLLVAAFACNTLRLPG